MDWLTVVVLIFVCVAVYLLATQKKGGDKSAEEQILGTQGKVTDEDTRFRARKEEKAATARADARRASNAEGQEVVNAKRVQAEAVQADFDLNEAPFRAEEARNQEQIAHDLLCH